MSSQLIPIFQGWFLYKYVRRDFYGCGVSTWAKPPAQHPEMFEKLDNVFPGLDVIRRRWGYADFANPAFDARHIATYMNNSTGIRKIVAMSTSGINTYTEAGVSDVTSLFAVPGSTAPRMVNSRSYGYFATGTSTQKKWDGTNSAGVTNWGIAAPVTAVSVPAPSAGGAITLKDGRNYYVAFRNSVTGHVSDLSPVSASTGPCTNAKFNLTNIPTSADSQVNQRVLLATTDGGDQTLLYLVTTLADNVTTTYTDNTPDTTLVLNSVYYEIDDAGLEHGCSGNQPPPAGSVVIKHKDRLVMISGNLLYVSKSLDEVTTSTGTIAGNYEECWNPTWAIDIAPDQTTTPKALLSDGVCVYIGDERTVRRISGDNILDFTVPEIVFNETGVVNQDVWKRVFMEGNPVGAIWLTPDYRVIQSDFNTYQDIGAPIQDLLLTINPQGQSNCVAMAVSDGEYDLYMLAIPTGTNTDPNVVCVYNLKTKTWAIWYPTDPVVGMHFNINASGMPQKIFGSNGTYKHLFLFDRSYSQDRTNLAATNFTATVRTTWLSFDNPDSRKVLNEIEVLTQDPGMAVSVEAASTVQDFLNPLTVVSNAPLVLSPFGQYKAYLASSTAKSRFYRFTFTSYRNVFQVLNGFAIEFVYVHQL